MKEIQLANLREKGLGLQEATKHIIDAAREGDGVHVYEGEDWVCTAFQRPVTDGKLWSVRDTISSCFGNEGVALQMVQYALRHIAKYEEQPV